MSSSNLDANPRPANSCKEHNWHEFITSTAVDLFIKHLKLYRKAQKKLEEELKAENKSSLVSRGCLSSWSPF